MAKLYIGERTLSGLIYAGTSPDTNRPFYVFPRDIPGLMTWNDGMEYAARYNWSKEPKGRIRLPTKRELSYLQSENGGPYENHFNFALMMWSDTRPHWSSTTETYLAERFKEHAWAQAMSTTRSSPTVIFIQNAIRLVLDPEPVLYSYSALAHGTVQAESPLP